MAGANGGPLPEAPAPTGSDSDALDSYIEANLDRFTEGSLRAAAERAGFSGDEIEKAIRRAGARRQTAPLAARARRIVLAAYAITYLVLVVGLVGRRDYSSDGGLLTLVLTIALGIALAIGLWWIGRRRTSAGLGTLLALPLVLLIAIGGICSFTSGSPFAFLDQVISGTSGPPGPPPDPALDPASVEPAMP